MTNTAMIALFTAVIGGILVSLLLYGGLWLTLGLMRRSARPAAVVVLSFFGRSVGALAVLAGTAKLGSWPAVMGAAGITMVARIAVTRMLKQQGKVQP